MDIKSGQVVVFKPEWRDKRDENIVFRAIEDSGLDDDRVDVVAEIGLTFNPISTVMKYMIQDVH